MLRSLFLQGNPGLSRISGGMRLMSRGDSGFDVTLIQAALADLGQQLPRSRQSGGTYDGVFGPETEAALSAFQALHKLKQDGVLGPKSLARLDGLMAVRNVAQSLPPKQRPARKFGKAGVLATAMKTAAKPPPKPSHATQPAVGAPPMSAAVAASILTVVDENYKLGTDDPALTRDVGSGEWNSEPVTAVARSQADWIMAILGKVTDVYPGPNATKHMKHFFGNTGNDLTIDVEDMIKATTRAQNRLIDEFRQAQIFVQSLPLGEHKFTSRITDLGYNRQSDTNDWYFALGGYSSWGKGTANIGMVAGQRRYEVDFEYHVFDRYNWDGKKKVEFFKGMKWEVKVTDEELQIFHRQGLAREFDCFGVAKRRLVWTGDRDFPSNKQILDHGGR
jgi:peptidoglycan hydrolase-like protein with peptidoglycan-binding domain